MNTVRRGAVVAVLTGLVLVVGTVVFVRTMDDSDELISRPWTHAELSDEDRRLTVWVEPPGDPTCEVFERLQVDRTGQTAFISALYRRTDQEFCIVPCPLQDEVKTLTLEEPLSGFSLAHGRGTVDSCR